MGGRRWDRKQGTYEDKDGMEKRVEVWEKTKHVENVKGGKKKEYWNENGGWDRDKDVKRYLLM